MSFAILLLAGVFEVAFVLALKAADGMTRLWPALLALASLAASIGLLGLAIRELPLGTAYAVWTGIGAVGSVLAGIVFFGDSASPARLLCVALVAAGIVGLRLTDG